MYLQILLDSETHMLSKRSPSGDNKNADIFAWPDEQSYVT